MCYIVNRMTFISALVGEVRKEYLNPLRDHLASLNGQGNNSARRKLCSSYTRLEKMPAENPRRFLLQETLFPCISHVFSRSHGSDRNPQQWNSKQQSSWNAPSHFVLPFCIVPFIGIVTCTVVMVVRRTTTDFREEYPGDELQDKFG